MSDKEQFRRYKRIAFYEKFLWILPNYGFTLYVPLLIFYPGTALLFSFVRWRICKI